MPNINLSKNTVCWLVTSLLAMFISYQLYQATTWGAGLSTDSITYLEGARSILKSWNLDGIGTHYPPLYFILIALTALITGDALEALRLLQLLTIALNFTLFTLIVWKGTHKALLPTIICSLLFVTSQSVLYIHTMAWSEGLFCFFALLGFYFLANYLEHENNRFPTLALSAFFIGLAFITRYVGVALIVTGVITLALYVSGNKTKRITDCFYFSFLSSFPMLLWMGRNWFISNAATSRQLVVHPISIEKVQIGIQVLLSWLFLPSNYPVILLLILLLIAITYVVSINNLDTNNINRTFEIYFIFIFTYILFLLISISLFDAHTPLDVRILFPVYLSFLLCLVLLSHRVYHTKSIRIVSYLMIFVLFLLAYAQIGIQKEYLSYASTNGIGFSSKKWSQSDMLQWVKKLPQDTIIYTNGPDAIKIIANRSSKMVPHLVSPVDRTENKNIQSDINEMVSKISDNKGVIIYLNEISWRWYLPTIKQLSQTLPLKLKYRGKDGIAVEIHPQIVN
jgi:4-amino-4-deoxy-L-arabinose transferase-like glycosyltransferase